MDIANDNSSTTMFGPGGIIYSDIEVVGDLDFIRVELLEGISYSIEVASPSSSFDVSLTLEDDMSNQIFSTFSSNDSLYRGFTATQTGTHFVVIGEFNTSDEGVGDYAAVFNSVDTIRNDVNTAAVLNPDDSFFSSISATTDRDYIAVTLDAGISYQFTARTDESNVDLNASLRDAGNMNVANSFTGLNGEDVIRFTPMTTGTYFVDIGAMSPGGNGGFLAEYELFLNDDDTISSDQAMATVLQSEVPVSSAIDTRDDIDTFTFDVVEGRTYGVELFSNTQDFTGFVRVLDSGQNQLLGAFSDTTAPQQTGFFSGISDTVFVQVETGFGTVEEGDYTLVVNFDDAHGNSPSTSNTTIAIGGSVSSGLEAYNDSDYFSVNLIEGLAYEFTFQSTNMNMLGGFGLRTSLNSFLTSANQFLNGYSEFEATVSTTDTYFVTTNTSGIGGIGDYTISAVLNDTIVNNTTTTTVLSAGNPVNSAIDTRNDRDFIEVNLVQGRSYGFKLDPDSPDVLMQMVLRDSGGGQEATASAFQAGNTVFLDFEATASGTFYLDVSGGNGQVRETNYTLTQLGDDLIPDNAMTPFSLTPGAPSTGTVNSGSDEDWFSVSLTEGLSYTIIATPLNMDGEIGIELEAANGTNTQATAFSSTGGAPATTSFVSDTSDPLYLKVSNGFSNARGFDYSIELIADDTIGGSIATTMTSISAPGYIKSALDNNFDKDYIALNATVGTRYLIEMHPIDRMDTSGFAVRDSGDNFLAGGNERSDGRFFTYVLNPDFLGGSGVYYIEPTGINSAFEYHIAVATDGNDMITGTGGDDVLVGFEGSDTIDGGGGNDLIKGGGDSDTLMGGAGDSDTLSYEDLFGGIEIDLSTNTAGGIGLSSGDTISGFENVFGSRSADIITGTTGDNILFGDEGADTINGLAGNDRISGGQDVDTLDGGADIDTLDLTEGVFPYNVDLIAGTTGITGETAINFENVELGGGNDTAFGTDGNNTMHGNGGSDLIDGRGGNDMIFGGSGADTLGGGSGNDTLAGGSGGDYIYGNSGVDTLNGNGGNDVMYGGSETDALGGDDGNDMLFGEGGVDYLYGLAGSDFIDGGTENDIIYGGTEADTIGGGDGDDYIQGDEGNDYIYGNEGSDTLLGNDGDDFIYGLGMGMNNLFGGEGNDFLYGGFNSDNMTGGAGADKFHVHGFAWHDFYLDFEDGIDKIDLAGEGWGYTSTTGPGATGAGGVQLTIVDDANGDAFISLGYNTWISVIGVSAAQLDDSDFIF